MTWDDESIKQLKKLWDKGLSTTEIAKKMNVSKNSVVGKVHRLCLKARPSPIKKKDDETYIELEQETLQSEQKEPVEISASAEKTPIAAVENFSTDGVAKVEHNNEPQKNTTIIPERKSKDDKKKHKHIKLVELDSHTCRWPIGDPRDDDFCFCGKKVHAGQTYCDEHSQVAYVKAMPRK